MKFSTMIDLAKDTQEIKEEIAKMSPPDKAEITVPVYPYCASFAIDEATLKKLGLDWDKPEDKPQSGDMIHVAGMAKVTKVSDREEERSDGTKERCRRVELQFTHLAVEDEDDEGQKVARQQRFYGGGETKAA
jgi:hypothetical protein